MPSSPRTGTALCLVMAALLRPAAASHFRYGVIEWKWMNYNADGTVKAPFDLEVTINHAWRREVAWYQSGSNNENTKELCAGFDADLSVDWGDGSKHSNTSRFETWKDEKLVPVQCGDDMVTGNHVVELTDLYVLAKVSRVRRWR